jgi:hypothetical protein
MLSVTNLILRYVIISTTSGGEHKLRFFFYDLLSTLDLIPIFIAYIFLVKKSSNPSICVPMFHTLANIVGLHLQC